MIITILLASYKYSGIKLVIHPHQSRQMIKCKFQWKVIPFLKVGAITLLPSVSPVSDMSASISVSTHASTSMIVESTDSQMDKFNGI